MNTSLLYTSVLGIICFVLSNANSTSTIWTTTASSRVSSSSITPLLSATASPTTKSGSTSSSLPYTTSVTAPLVATTYGSSTTKNTLNTTTVQPSATAANGTLQTTTPPYFSSVTTDTANGTVTTGGSTSSSSVRDGPHTNGNSLILQIYLNRLCPSVCASVRLRAFFLECFGNGLFKNVWAGVTKGGGLSVPMSGVVIWLLVTTGDRPYTLIKSYKGLKNYYKNCTTNASNL